MFERSIVGVRRFVADTAHGVGDALGLHDEHGDEIRGRASIDDLNDPLTMLLGSIGTIIRTALDSPRLSAYLLGKHMNPGSSGYLSAADPHHYDHQNAAGARFLAGGRAIS